MAEILAKLLPGAQQIMKLQQKYDWLKTEYDALENTYQQKHAPLPDHAPDGYDINSTGKIEYAFEYFFVKCQPDPESGNTPPYRNQHCQLSKSHNQHNKKQQIEQAFALGKNYDNSGQFHYLGNDDYVVS